MAKRGQQGGALSNRTGVFVRRDARGRTAQRIGHVRAQQEGGHLQARKRCLIRN